MWLRNLSSEKQPTEIMIKCGFIAVDYDIFSRYISALVPTAYTYLGRHKIGAGRLRRIVSPPNGFFFYIYRLLRIFCCLKYSTTD